MMMMRHLAWKDAQTIRPLVVAAVAGIVFLHLTVAVVGAMTTPSASDMAGVFVSLWILMPNLVALGAPALLVGGEEESGTLNWLRTLPVSWQKVVDSKFLVGVSAVAATWVAASIVLAIALSTAGSMELYHREMVALRSILHLGFFSLLLLSTGFVTAYLFRSPVTGLIALIPLIIFLYVIALSVAGWIVNGNFRGTRFSASTNQLAVLAAAGIGGLVMVWLAQRWLGRRRLTRQQGFPLSRWKSPPTVAAYRPPARAGTSRPSETTALLWQQWSQMRLPGLMLTALVAFFLIACYGIESNRSRGQLRWTIAEFTPLVTVLGGCWLGALAFYGDNVRRRCAFFADRGVSPGHVWWTRLAPSVVCISLLLIVAVSLHFMAPDAKDQYGRTAKLAHPTLIPSLLLLSFAFGQLVGQWVRRPTLAFFGTPAYGLISCTPWTLPVSTIYVNYFWTILLMVPVLLFATRRLTSRWLDDKVDRGFHIRVLAYTALATLVPIVTILGHRYATTPAEITPWRAEMLAIDDPALGDNDAPRADWALLSSMIKSTPPQPLDDDPSTLRDTIERLETQVADQGPGEFTSVYALDEHIQLRYLQKTEDVNVLQRTSIRLLLKWAKMLREDIAGGRVGVWPAIQTAARAESLAARGLAQLSNTLGTTPELAELVAMIPSSELRRRSRENGLINEWRQYQQTPWKREIAGTEWYGKAFMGRPVAVSVNRIPLERTRADRFIDLATRRSLAQLAAGLPALDSEQTTETNVLWSEARGPRRSLDDPVHQFLPWPNNSDTLIDEVRARYPSVLTQP